MKLNLSTASAAREISQPPPVRLMCVGGLLDGRTREDKGERLAALPARPFPRVDLPENIVSNGQIEPIFYRKVEFAKPHVRRRFYVVEGMTDEDALARVESKGLMP